MRAPSSRSDETEMNHGHVRSCRFQWGSAHDLFALLVWLQLGHNLQRSQILQVSPVINQSNMSWVPLSVAKSRAGHKQSPNSLTVDIPHCASVFSKSWRGCKMVRKLWISASHHYRAISTVKVFTYVVRLTDNLLKSEPYYENLCQNQYHLPL